MPGFMADLQDPTRWSVASEVTRGEWLPGVAETSTDEAIELRPARGVSASRSMRLALPLVAVALHSLAYGDRAHERLRYTDEAIAELRRRGACTSKSPRWWCRAIKWSDGTNKKLPLGQPLVGRWLTKGEPGLHVRSKHKIDERDELVGCVITGTADHPMIRLETLHVDDPASRTTVTSVLEGKTARAKVDARVAAELRKLTGQYPVISVDGEWFWDERSDDVRLRYVDGYWVAILSGPPAAARSYPDARLVYVLTDAWE